jgi:hypothetical protein
MNMLSHTHKHTLREYLKTKKGLQLTFPQRSLNTSYKEKRRGVESEGKVALPFEF